MRFSFSATWCSGARRASLFSFVVLAVAACGPPTPVYKVHHALTPPPTDTGRLCAAQCLNTKQHCVQNAKLQQSIERDRCEERARRVARRDYKQYVARRRAKGKRIKREERDFYSGYSCGNASDDGFCQDSYHQCYTTCGGQVASKSICVANCDVPVTQTGSVAQSGALLASAGPGPALQPVQTGSSLPVSGTWGITTSACSPQNQSGDGVLKISKAEIRNGMDLCLVDKVTPLANGMYQFQTRCQGAEGGRTFPTQFHFATRTPNMLTYDNKKFGRIEQWVRCS